MSFKKTFRQQLKIYFSSLFITILKLRFRWSPSKKGLMKELWAGQTPERRRKIFADYAPTEHDVFVPCFPRSGTYWMLQITQQIAYYGEAEFKHIHDLVPWPGAFSTAVPLYDPVPQQKSPTGLRIIKAHESSDYIPYSEKATYVIVVRDPKEVFVSAKHFAFGFLSPQEMLSVDEMLELLLEDDIFVLGDWAQHTNSYWQWRDRPNVLLLTFAELKKEPHSCIQRVADVMGVELTAAQLDKVVAKSDIAYMKKQGFAFSAPLPPLPTLRKKDVPPLIRQGKLNSADEMLTAEQKGSIDDHWRARLEELGSDFPYDELFVTNRAEVTARANESDIVNLE